MTTQDILLAANRAKPLLSLLTGEQKNRGLAAMADAVEVAAPEILAANALDMREAKASLSPVMLDRLLLTGDRVAGMAKGIRDVALLPDPTGRVLDRRVITDGLELTKIAVPLGVVAIIYESRPNVTSDAAALCLKSGNACVLRGGREAYRTAAAITRAMRAGLERAGLPADAVQMVEDTTRAGAEALMKARGLVDLLIPRGGAGLIRACVEQACVPVIETGTGICSVDVDRAADLDMAERILVNAKTQRPSVCNAAEQCLVDAPVAASFLPRLRRALVEDRIGAGLPPVELRLCPRAAAIIPGTPRQDRDLDTEFLDYILAVTVVDGVDGAVEHIARHSTHHSEAIITGDESAAARFAARVDSAAVYINASTRYTDGGVFGLGCEMGISTQKLHARGPMGLEELTSYKYVIKGEGQVRK